MGFVCGVSAAFFLLDVLTGVSAAFVTDLTLAGDFGSFFFVDFLPLVGDSGASSFGDLALDDMFARLRGDGARARVGRGVVMVLVRFAPASWWIVGLGRARAEGGCAAVPQSCGRGRWGLRARWEPAYVVLLGFLRWKRRRRFLGMRGARAAAQRATARRRRSEGLAARAGAYGLVVSRAKVFCARGNVKEIFSTP